MKYAVVFAPAVIVALASCAGQQASSPLPLSAGGQAAHQVGHSTQTSPIKHIVILFQENRSTDYLFQSPKLIAEGANIAQSGLDSEGNVVQLQPISLAAGWDLGHGYLVFQEQYDGGKMDGFDKIEPPNLYWRPYGYAPQSEVRPYWDMATQYVFADNMFQTNQSSSYPSHQYIVSATARALPTTHDEIEGGPYYPSGKKGPAGCDAPQEMLVDTISLHGGSRGPSLFPCFDRPVLSDFLDQVDVSWRFYQRGFGPGWWHSMDSISHVRYGPDYANVVSPPEAILSDVSTGTLPGFSWVMPADDLHSDHPGSRSTAGPSWIAAVVNAIGESQYWNSTAIFVTWDDWGGWYDHVPPKIYNSYELGFRVPLVVISAYAKKAYVSHRRHEFASMLVFAEKTFGIPKGALGGTDQRADDLMDAFNFARQPRAFVPIKAPPFVPGKQSQGPLNAEDY